MQLYIVAFMCVVNGQPEKIICDVRAKSPAQALRKARGWMGKEPQHLWTKLI